MSNDSNSRDRETVTVAQDEFIALLAAAQGVPLDGLWEYINALVAVGQGHTLGELLALSIGSELGYPLSKVVADIAIARSSA